MTTVIVSAAVRNQLLSLKSPVQLSDESGRVLGYFHPIPLGSRREPQIGEEEIRRRLDRGGGRTLPEIMADFEKRV